ncbi:hypothetical protein FRX31_010117 [Thalictrum thalictroides]|uniref:Uncharacterized protein n=1 Tax=Thalictrum thalictroides TaxID=46969 RepID=A0A7J6WUX8_THATH|nr:hypothetical protein FRX31_010117 [Thalictrum thalictroides]
MTPSPKKPEMLVARLAKAESCAELEEYSLAAKLKEKKVVNINNTPAAAPVQEVVIPKCKDWGQKERPKTVPDPQKAKTVLAANNG